MNAINPYVCKSKHERNISHNRFKGLKYFFLLLIGGVRWKSSFRQAPLLTAAPVRGLIDEQISITGRFLPPDSPVTVRARMHSEEGDLWESFAHYNTTADGTVNCESH